MKVLAIAAVALAAPLTYGTAAVAVPLPRDVTIQQPVRVMDTRVGTGAPAHQLVPGEATVLQLPQAVSAGATSVVLNLTAVNGAVDGWVKAWPCDVPEPSASAVNYAVGRTSANAAIVKVVPEGVCFTSQSPVDLVVDLSGWFVGDEDVAASVPARVLDTRITGDPLRAEIERRLQIAGTPGIDPGANAAVVNLTVDRPALDGYVVAYPCGRPSNGSTVNFLHGEIVANVTVVALAGGEVCMRSNVDVEVVVDTYGWTDGIGRLRVESPDRLLDTRDIGTWSYGPTQSGSTVHLRVAGRGGVPNSASAALVTVTVADARSEGFVTVWPCDQPRPLASTINTFAGALRSNIALVRLPADGTICLYHQSANLTATSLVVDAVGWVIGDVARAEPTTPGSVVPGAPGDPATGPGPGSGGPGNPGSPGNPGQPDGPVPPPGGSGPAAAGGTDTGCAFSVDVSVAFCDSFNAPATNTAASRAGALNGTNWTVARTGSIVDLGQSEYNEWVLAAVAGCGGGGAALPPDDIRICDGRLYEAADDAQGQTIISMSPKQPFDVAGRTGRIVFDVSADSEGEHAAWPEVWWTDEPVPAGRSLVSAQRPYPRNGFGFSIASSNCPVGTTGVNQLTITRNYVPEEVPFTPGACIVNGSATDLNHVEVRVSTGHVEVWATDAGAPTLKLIASADLQMPLSRGFVSLTDVHFDADKFNHQRRHTFVWDNVGFDGPRLYRDLAFDVPDARTPGHVPGSVALGYLVSSSRAFEVPDVYWLQQPTTATITFNWYPYERVVPDVRINGGPWHSTPWPFDEQGFSWRTIAVPVAVGEVHPGLNTVEFRTGPDTVVANIDVILTAASPVP